MGKISKHEEYLVLVSGAKAVYFSKNMGVEGSRYDHRNQPSFN